MTEFRKNTIRLRGSPNVHDRAIIDKSNRSRLREHPPTKSNRTMSFTFN